jgi:hypothetical protein
MTRIFNNTAACSRSAGSNLTIVTARKPARLSKAFLIDDSGELKKSNGGVLAEGVFMTAQIKALQDLSEILVGLDASQALIFGVPVSEVAHRIVTKEAFAALGEPDDATPRTNEAFRWPVGLGVLMLDYDAPSNGDPLNHLGLVQAIRAAAPGLEDAAMLWRPSASSCIFKDNEELIGIRGQRLYMLVQDASDIERAGKVLFDRLWLAGYGHIQITRSGSLHERTLIDSTVWQSSRLDFAGGAYCSDGLEQRRGVPIRIPGSVEIVDTATALPPLSPAEISELSKLVKAARAADDVQTEAQIAREAWIAERAEEMATRIVSSENANPADVAEAIARRALDHAELGGAFPLEVIVENTVVAISVADLLADRERFHGCRTRDPLEPEYDGGRAVGRLYLMQAQPTLYSFARGGRAYKLNRAPVRMEVPKGKDADVANATVELLRADPTVFDFGAQLARVSDGRILPMCEHLLANHVPSLIQYWAYQQRGDAIVAVDRNPPTSVLKQIMAKGADRKLKPLDAVITGPTVRLDGTVLSRPGYDPDLRLLLDPVEEVIPVIPEQPTLDDASRALNRLLLPFKDFPFVDALAHGALLSALLTAIVRGIVPTAPAHAFDAPVQGSGKTLLAMCVGALLTGRQPDVWPHTAGRDDEETRKRLFAALRAGSGALVWDNLIGTFDSASLAMFLTSPSFSDRILGKSETVNIPNRAMLLLTGNNLSLAGDLPRRVIICRIDPNSATPFDRSFDLDPLKYVLANRMTLLAAACTLIRARFVHWQKLAPGKLASFEDWDHMVRQTVCFADTMVRPGTFGDPMQLVKEAQAADPEVEMLAALLDALFDSFGISEFTAKDVHNAACSPFGMADQSPLGEALREIAGDKAMQSVRSIGRILQNRVGRIANHRCVRSRKYSSAGVLGYRIENTWP